MGELNQGGLSKARIEALTDGVFAIAMTLLVFGLKVPQVPHHQPSEPLRSALVALWPQLLSYATSFVILGIYWVGHHNQFHYIRRADRSLFWINIGFLMFVTFIPFSTGLLGQYPEERISTAVYGCNLIIVGLLLYLHWMYATGGYRLIDPGTSPKVIKLAKRRILAAPVVITISIVFSFYSIKLSLLLYLLIPLYYIVPGTIDRAWHPTQPRQGARSPGSGSG
jgi:uncharacterized membrane protein